HTLILIQLRVSHEVAVNVLAGTTLMSRLLWGRICFQAHSCGSSWTIGLRAPVPHQLAGGCLPSREPLYGSFLQQIQRKRENQTDISLLQPNLQGDIP
uniref:Uncharacterized protein n=1 Tax=Suricata suricatta TaxID=37032 RepID=A0A673V5H6_SURSU